MRCPLGTCTPSKDPRDITFWRTPSESLPRCIQIFGLQPLAQDGCPPVLPPNCDELLVQNRAVRLLVPTFFKPPDTFCHTEYPIGYCLGNLCHLEDAYTWIALHQKSSVKVLYSTALASEHSETQTYLILWSRTLLPVDQRFDNALCGPSVACAVND